MNKNSSIENQPGKKIIIKKKDTNGNYPSLRLRTQSAGISGRVSREASAGSRLRGRQGPEEVELYKTLVLQKNKVVTAATHRGVMQDP